MHTPGKIHPAASVAATATTITTKMIDTAENIARENSVSCVQLDIRETQQAAIQLFKSKGYKQWGINPNYALVEGKIIKGLYFYKDI